MARLRQAAACIVLAIVPPLSTGSWAAEPASTPSSSASGVAHPAMVVSDQPVRLLPKATARVAHSALLTVDATAMDDSLRLSIRRVHDRSLINSDDITVTVDGKKEPVTHETADSLEIPINDLRGNASRDSPHDVEIIVPHDGIREIVAGKVTAIEGSSGGGLLGDHKQMAWWILNIAIVLIGAIALSRRKG